MLIVCQTKDARKYIRLSNQIGKCGHKNLLCLYCDCNSFGVLFCDNNISVKYNIAAQTNITEELKKLQIHFS